MACRMAYNAESMFSYLKINFTQVYKEETQSAMQNNNVSKSVFHFLGVRIQVLVPVYQHENPSEYVTDVTYQHFFERYEQKGQL